MAKQEESKGSVDPQTVSEVAAAANEVVRAKAENPEALLDDLIHNTQASEYIKGNEDPAGGWMHGPANIELLKVGFDKLLKVADARGSLDRKITKVRASLLKSKKTVYIYPTDDDDPDAILVHPTRYGARINLISLLGATRYTLPTGHRRKYEFQIAPEGESPVGPALVLNLGRPLEKRWAKESDSEGAGKGQATAKSPATATKADAKPAPAQKAESVAEKPEKAE